MVTTVANDNNQAPAAAGQLDRSPAEAALLMRLKVYLTMRWMVVIGVIVAALFATQVMHIGFTTMPVYIIAAVMFAYNLVLMYQVRSLETLRGDVVMRRIRYYGITHIVLDLLAFTILLHFTGGIENPFIFIVAMHIIGGSTLLRRRAVFWISIQSMVMVALLVILEYAGIIPHVDLAGFSAPGLYRQGDYILAVLVVLASIMVATTYMTTAITAELRKRQRQVVRLRERLLAEKTGELEQRSREVAKLEEEKNRFLRFIGVAAHDMKAPLAAIQSYFGVMLGGYAGDLSEKQKGMLQRSSIRITELMKLISDLLDIPRIETGQLVPEMKPASLRDIVKGSVDELSHLAEQKGIKLQAEIPETLPEITGSAPRLLQVLNNLVNNAICYTPKGDITVRVTERADDLLVEVADCGIGIPPQDLPKLFTDFFRASNVEAKGTGLGLSIARRIVEAHGGKIWVESPCPTTGVGSKFSFTLPKDNRRQST